MRGDIREKGPMGRVVSVSSKRTAPGMILRVGALTLLLLARQTGLYAEDTAALVAEDRASSNSTCRLDRR